MDPTAKFSTLGGIPNNRKVHMRGEYKVLETESAIEGYIRRYKY